jgi:hypothetical protein
LIAADASIIAGLTAAGRSLPGPRTAIEAAMVAARQQTETTTATIGTFTAAENGYTGSVKTLTLNVKAGFVASEKENDRLSHLRRRHRLCRVRYYAEFRLNQRWVLGVLYLFAPQ